MDFKDRNFSNIYESDVSLREDSAYDIQSIQEVEGALSKRFVSIYKRNCAFHDWYLNKFEYITSNKQRKDKFCIHISHTYNWPHQIDKRYLLIFYGIENVRMDMKCAKDYELYCSDEYLFDRWRLISKNRIGYELYMASSSKISLTCSGVIIQSVK